MVAMTKRRGRRTAAAISPPDNDDEFGEGGELLEVEDEDVLPEVEDDDVLLEAGMTVEVEEEEDVLPQIFTPVTQDPLLHVSFAVQALESLQGVPFGRTANVHPLTGSHPVELRH